MSPVLFLAGWALRSAALIAAGGLALRLCRVKSPAMRLAALTALLCASLLLPLLIAGLSPVRIELPPIVATRGRVLWAVDQAALALARAPSAAPAHASAVASTLDWPRLALAVYLACAGALLLRLCAGLVLAGRLLGRARPTGRSSSGIAILESDEVSGPLALGILRPAIVLPVDWPEWDGLKLSAVLAHESSHILRRDPVVQVLSATHRALLWHNPLGWVLHRRIVRASEEASDDAAVAAIRDRAKYAETLLDFMRRGVRAPKWQGVAMARYGKAEARIHRILDAATPGGSVTRRGVAAMLALGAPIVFLAAARLESAPSLASPSRLFFAEASVKQAADGEPAGPVRALQGGEHYTAKAATLRLLIALMYKVPERQIIGGPDWIATEPYDVEASAARGSTLADLHSMFQNLLAARFQLRFHTYVRQGPVYALRVAAGGLKMRVHDGPDEFQYPVARGTDGVIYGSRASMEYFAWWLTLPVFRDRRPVIDRTGLTGNYDFTLAFAPLLPPGFPLAKLPPAVRSRPSIFDALRAQLGLELNAEDGPIEYLAIDRAERPR
ncbi:MAG TPA: M56 family metallopeptidase [Bryobacteraceae bacterium]|nr:M56 family metallopeptidase [Bryobacteraceae bacterium]